MNRASGTWKAMTNDLIFASLKFWKEKRESVILKKYLKNNYWKLPNKLSKVKIPESILMREIALSMVSEGQILSKQPK